MEHPLSDMMTNTMSKIKDMIDVNTVVGSPITTPGGVTIIPVTKVSIRYGGGLCRMRGFYASSATFSASFAAFFSAKDASPFSSRSGSSSIRRSTDVEAGSATGSIRTFYDDQYHEQD